MNFKGSSAIILFSLLLLMLVATAATGHFQPPGVDSVDSSTSPAEIRWRDYTSKDTARQHAIDAWNSLSGGVNIRADTSSTVADLDFRDYYADDGRCGHWVLTPGADDLNLNSRPWGNYTQTQRNACSTHELGHAHRLAHSYNDQVMDNCPVCRDPLVSVPQNHDRSDYHQIW